MERVTDSMIERHVYSESAKVYMQLRLSAGGALERKLSEKVMAKEGHTFSYLPNRLREEAPDCFGEDMLALTPTETGTIKTIHADFIHSFLQSSPNAGLVIANFPERQIPNGFSVAHLEPLGGVKTDGNRYSVILGGSGGLNAARELVSGFPGFQFFYSLVDLPGNFTALGGSREMDAALLNSLVAGCRHIVVSAFGHYAILAWSGTGGESNGLLPADTAHETDPSHVPARVELPQSAAYYFQQRLCVTLWRPGWQAIRGHV